MKLFKIVTLSFIFSVLLVNLSFAQELNSKKGVNFTWGIIGLGGVYHEDQNDGLQFGGMGHMRLGYGINEKINVFFDSSASLAPITGNYASKGIFLASFSLGAQIFPSQDYDYFLTPKAGFATSVVLENLTVANTTGSGFTTGLGAGYEWRFGKSFALSPEVRFDYYNFSGSNAYSTGVVLNLQWY